MILTTRRIKKHLETMNQCGDQICVITAPTSKTEKSCHLYIAPIRNFEVIYSEARLIYTRPEEPKVFKTRTAASKFAQRYINGWKLSNELFEVIDVTGLAPVNVKERLV